MQEYVKTMHYQSKVLRTGNMRSLARRNESSGSSSNTFTASGLNPCLLQVTGVHWLYNRTCCISESLVDALGESRGFTSPLLIQSNSAAGTTASSVAASSLANSLAGSCGVTELRLACIGSKGLKPRFAANRGTELFHRGPKSWKSITL